MTDARQPGRALFYHRDSGGGHEMTPGEYFRWAQSAAADLGASLAGSTDQFGAMITRNLSQDGDLFLDYGVAGNDLDRPGLKALIAVAFWRGRMTHTVCTACGAATARAASGGSGSAGGYAAR